jgi:hypothetical protein
LDRLSDLIDKNEGDTNRILGFQCLYEKHYILRMEYNIWHNMLMKMAPESLIELNRNDYEYFFTKK